MNRRTKKIPSAAKARRPHGQAMAETALLTVLLFGLGGALVYFFPDSFNALQIYMDGFYNVFAMPIP